MADEQKQNTIWVRAVLLTILIGLSTWVYFELTQSYSVIEESFHVMESLLQENNRELKYYQKELAVTKDALALTESQLASAREENRKLSEQIALLGKVEELEETIARLKEKNEMIINHMSSIRQEYEARAERDEIPEFATIEKGKTVLAKLRDKVRRVKVRIRDIKHQEYVERVKSQQEDDQRLLELGNNGYLVKNGKLSPSFNPADEPAKHVQIDVRIVE